METPPEVQPFAHHQWQHHFLQPKSTIINNDIKRRVPQHQPRPPRRPRVQAARVPHRNHLEGWRHRGGELDFRFKAFFVKHVLLFRNYGIRDNKSDASTDFTAKANICIIIVMKIYNPSSFLKSVPILQALNINIAGHEYQYCRPSGRSPPTTAVVINTDSAPLVRILYVQCSTYLSVYIVLRRSTQRANTT